MTFARTKFINVFSTATSLLSISLAVISFRIPNWIITRRFLGAGSLEPPGYIESDVIVRGGLQTLKYFTITGQYGGSVSAVNQFVDLEFLSTLEKAWHYYFLKPFDGFLSIAAKVFALLDWDVPFAFNNDSLELAPFFLSFANYVLVANGVLGIGYFIYRSLILNNRTLSDWFLLIAGVLFLPYLAIHTLFHVEIRYGLPLLQITTISAGIFLLVLRDRRRVVFIQLMIVVIWVPLSFIISNWIRNGISV